MGHLFGHRSVKVFLAVLAAGTIVMGVPGTSATAEPARHAVASEEARAKPKPKPKPIRNESFAFLGEVAPFIAAQDSDGSGGIAADSLADPLVGRLGDGTYIMLALRGTREKPYVAWRSQDLKTWDRYAEYSCTLDVLVEGPCQGRMIGFQSMEDGRLRFFFLDYGPQVIRSVVTADGITWEQEWDVKLRLDDFPDVDRLEFAYIAQMPDKSWRMYITALICDAPNMRGRPNCEDVERDGTPDEPADMGLLLMQRIANTYISASSPDGITWTPDPGIRWQASQENGSFARLAVRSLPNGKVELVSLDTSMHNLKRTSLLTLKSDDGLTFRKFSDQPIAMGDPHFVVDPQGKTKIVSSGMGPGTQGGILLWEPVVTTWTAGDAQLTDLAINGIDKSSQGCWTIPVKGTGQLSIDVKGDDARWDDRGKADASLYSLSSRKLKAPGVIRVSVRQLDQNNPANVRRPDFPRYVTITERKTGVVRLIPLFPDFAQSRLGPACSFTKR